MRDPFVSGLRAILYLETPPQPTLTLGPEDFQLEEQTLKPVNAMSSLLLVHS